MATPRSKPSSYLRQYPSNSLASQVRVVLRVRPFLPSEIASNDKNLMPCFTVLDSEHSTGEEVTVHIQDQYTSRNECYKLDSFFEQGDRVAQIFQREVSSVIPGIFQGLNATVFAYGTTGSGKTYTMQGTEEEPGLIPLAISTILSMCDSTRSSVEISYYEVYMDRCYDLLEPKAKEILALDDTDGQVQLKGLSSVQVHSMDEFCQVFSTGNQRRKVAHTGLNDVSSRSHGVLMIVVANGNVKGKLNLIDLAGNEDNRRTCNEGIRLQESAKINQSLFCLSNVFLNNNEPWIPYRASKLTRILQDSLGGKSRALMIACLNPTSYQEAVHTVSLAARSRQIVNYACSANKRDTPREKVDMEAKLQAWLESKGKTKNVHRKNGPCSPFLGKTLSSVTSLKKSALVWSSSKAKASDVGVLNTKGRKLFDSEAAISTAIEKSRHHEEEMIDLQQHNTMGADCKCELRDETCQQHACAFHVKDYPEPSESAYSCKDDCCGDRGANLWDTSSACRTEYSEKYTIPNSNVEKEASLIAERRKNTMEGKVTTDVSVSRQLNIPGTPNKENVQSCVGSPLINEKLQELHNSIRRVLSPVSNNGTPIKHLALKDQSSVFFLDPKTPKTQSGLTNDSDEIPMTDTPLDKFNSSSCNLKDSLVQEYLSFLNVASNEELLQLKGIGQRRAEYILQLREDTPKPLKSLSDLEKIGLSSKQVHNMFRRVATGIFT